MYASASPLFRPQMVTCVTDMLRLLYRCCSKRTPGQGAVEVQGYQGTGCGSHQREGPWLGTVGWQSRAEVVLIAGLLYKFAVLTFDTRNTTVRYLSYFNAQECVSDPCFGFKFDTAEPIDRDRAEHVSNRQATPRV